MTAKNIMIATGSVPFVPPGIPIDGKTVQSYPTPAPGRPSRHPAQQNTDTLFLPFEILPSSNLQCSFETILCTHYSRQSNKRGHPLRELVL